MNISTLQSNFSTLITELHSEFSSLTNLFEKQYDKIKEIFILINTFNQSQSNQASNPMDLILERLQRNDTIKSLKDNNIWIERAVLKINSRIGNSSLTRTDLKFCYMLISEVTKNILSCISYSNKELKKCHLSAVAYHQQFPENLHVTIEMTDTAASYDQFNRSIKDQVTLMREKYQLFKTAKEGLENHLTA